MPVKDGTARPHTLVVGGTGMLRRATLHFASKGHGVSVIARTPAGLERLQREAKDMPGAIYPLAVDYRALGALEDALTDAVERRGPIGLAICWIHAVGRSAFPVIVEKLAAAKRPWRLFHVRGSAAADPRWTEPAPVKDLVVAPGLYREVVLGFVIEGSRSRWLTDGEISLGVIRAVEDDGERTVIGAVEPWERRP